MANTAAAMVMAAPAICKPLAQINPSMDSDSRLTAFEILAASLESRLRPHHHRITGVVVGDHGARDQQTHRPSTKSRR
jgi:hypothetical protein